MSRFFINLKEQLSKFAQKNTYFFRVVSQVGFIWRTVKKIFFLTLIADMVQNFFLKF